MDDTIEPAWAKRIEEDVGKIAKRVDSVDRRLSAIESDGIPRRVTNLEAEVSAMRPMLQDVVEKINGIAWAVKIIGGGLGGVVVILQIVNLIQ